MPVARAASVLGAVIEDRPWDHAALDLADAEWHLACHRAFASVAVDATREAADLARHAARLRAVAPTALTSLRFYPAVQRFRDRLVAFGATGELTGRDAFRLHGM